MSYLEIPSKSAKAIKTVPTAASLPANVAPGSLRYAQDTQLIYSYNGTSWSAVGGGGSATPSAPTNSVQYNNAGSFGGSANLSWDNTNGTLTATSVNAANPAVVAKAAALQSANLVEFQNSSAVAQSAIDANGYMIQVTGTSAGTPANGALYVDSTAANLYYRTGSSWGSPSSKKFASGFYYFVNPVLSVSATTLSVTVLRVAPTWIGNAITLIKLGAEVTTIGDVGSVVRLGIYADTGFGLPGNLVLDAGTIAGDVAGVQEITINQPLTAGNYWFGSCVQNVTVTQPILRVSSVSVADFSSPTIPAANAAYACYAIFTVTGALPSNFSTGLTPFNAPPARMFFKVQ